jgi:hypothetical protein
MDERQSKLAPDLIAAYKNTLFQAHVGDEVITLRVGQKCHALQAVFEQHNVTTACYITACNPFGRLLTKQENEARNARLLRELAALYPVFEGVGVDPAGEWEGEASLLALGVSEEVSLALADVWEQNAVVFVDETFTVSLLFTK